MKDMAQPLTVLLADADAIVAMDLSDALESAGYRVLGPFATTAEALLSLDQDSPNVAVVDAMLRDGPTTALADGLRRRRVPFLVHSGLERDDPAVAAAGFQNEPWLHKPPLPWDVVILLDELALKALAREEASASVHVEPASSERASAHTGDVYSASVRLLKAPKGQGNPLVGKLEGFVTLSDADKGMLERICTPSRIVPAQTALVHEGEAPEGVFLILEGMACRYKVRATGARQITAYLVPGDLCDLDVALLDTMDHSISTLSACRVVLIPPKAVAEVMKHHPQVARALRMSTLVDEATLREWLVNVGCRSALERVAHLFCELQVRLRAVGLSEGDSYDLPLTQVDLADTFGLSNVHLNRTLQELRRRGLITLRQRRLTILDFPRLKALAEFKTNYLHLGERAAA